MFCRMIIAESEGYVQRAMTEANETFRSSEMKINSEKPKILIYAKECQ